MAPLVAKIMQPLPLAALALDEAGTPRQFMTLSSKSAAFADGAVRDLL
jgi:hypothetical protein